MGAQLPDLTGCTGQINGSLDLHSKLCDIFTQHDVTNQAGREGGQQARGQRDRQTDSKTVGLTVNDWSVIAAAAATAPDWLATHTQAQL